MYAKRSNNSLIDQESEGLNISLPKLFDIQHGIHELHNYHFKLFKFNC